MERCLEGKGNRLKDLEISKSECEALEASFKAWDELIISSRFLQTKSPMYLRLEGKKERKIEEVLSRLNMSDRYHLQKVDQQDPFKRSRLEQAIDAHILEYVQRGDTRPLILDYTSKRRYWKKYESMAGTKPNRN